MGLTDSLKCNFSCHDQRSVTAAGLDLYSESAKRGRSLALAARGWTCGEPLSKGWLGSAAAEAGRMACRVVPLHTAGRVWRFGVAVTRWSRSTQLLYIEPG